jgi:group I intron endonuclease
MRIPIIGIYQIRNRTNGKSYVGQSNNIRLRWERHIKDAQDGSDRSILYSAIRKYGLSAFDFNILETIDAYSQEKLNELEIKYIQQLHSFRDDPLGGGYNSTLGGAFGKIDEEANLRRGRNISRVKKGKNYPCMYKPRSEQTRKRISESHKGRQSSFRGRKHTDATCKRISQRLRGHTAYNKGKAMSDAQKQKLHDAMVGREGPRKGAVVTEDVKLKIGKSQTKRVLTKKGVGIKIVFSEKNIRYFVTSNEMAIKLLGKSNASMAKLIDAILADPNYTPKAVSKNWRFIRSAKIVSCSQLELLEHRPELK